MLKGVTQKEYKIITGILKNFEGKFYAYGSRVRGDFSDLSDLDVLVKSEKDVIPKLKLLFDASRLPYIVNFTDYSSIDGNFYNLIKQDLVEII